MSRISSTPGWLRELCNRRPWTAQDAHRVLDELEASRLGVGEFASRAGLVAQRLYWWRDRLSLERRSRKDQVPRRSAMSELIPVTVRAVLEPTAAQMSPIEVMADQQSGVRVKVNDLSPAAAMWVATMLRSLHEAQS